MSNTEIMQPTENSARQDISHNKQERAEEKALESQIIQELQKDHEKIQENPEMIKKAHQFLDTIKRRSI